MINNLSAQLTNRLISKGTISENEQELYCYGFFMLLSQLLYFILAAVFGLILGCFFESVIFYIAFQFIRRYAGGYHAKTETRCEIMSALSITACIVVIRMSTTYNFNIVILCLAAVATIFIAVLSPLDTPEKPLSEKEFRYFRKISWIILFVLTTAIVISYFVGFSVVFVSCSMSLILESILLIAGKIKKSIQKKLISQ